MVLPSSAGARFRQRKISVKQTVQVWKQSDLPDLETEDQQRELQQIETGVEKGEEEEHHLQAVINATQAKIQGAKVQQVYIPTPDASKVWKDAPQYYTKKFIEPASYIRFSATVEDTMGCPYNIDEIDEEFLKEYNKKLPADKKCSEEEFEMIAHRMEIVIKEKQPFLSMDPSQILSYKEIKQIALVPDSADPSDVCRTLEKQLNIHPFRTLLDADSADGCHPRPLPELFGLYGSSIYEHWKKRRLERNGQSIFPSLKYEDPSQKDDNDPYVCFRRREFRQARKTRRTDAQGTEKLEQFYHELRKSRNLLFMIAQREIKRKEQLSVELDIFKLRCQVKSVKRELGIKGEEEDLITHKKKKAQPDVEQMREQLRKEAERDRRKRQLQQRERLHINNTQLNSGSVQNGSGNPIAAQPYVKLPSSKIPDLDLTTVNTVLQDKLEGIKKAVADKLSRRQLQDEGWINFTDDPYNPYFSIAGNEDENLKERSHVPYASLCSSLYEVEDSKETKLSSIFNNNKHYSHNDSDITKINAQTGEVVRSDKHNHLPVFYDIAGEDNYYEDYDYYSQNSLTNGKLNVSETLYKVRKRFGVGGRLWLDRKRVEDDFGFLDYVDYFGSDDDVVVATAETVVSSSKPKRKRRNVYDSDQDYKRRLKSKFEFDSDLAAYSPLDPSKLNQIGKQTQVVRFGSMLLAKSYDNMHQIRQKQIEAHKMFQQRLLQQKQQREASANGNSNTSSSDNNNSQNNMNGSFNGISSNGFSQNSSRHGTPSGGKNNSNKSNIQSGKNKISQNSKVRSH